MPLWLKVSLQIIFFVIVFMVVYNQLKIHVLSKLHPNKWIILVAAVVSFFLPPMVAAYFRYNLANTVWQYVQSVVFIVFFLWFVDLNTGAIYDTTSKNKRKKDVTIKPKPKPNRAKNYKKNKK
ncbi:hypothetical protein D4Z93_11320 [Clostridium fermenticellae]|uniref:Uncharacterized protein n=1 Tax=Clostridium fermenticellae TaxID=2068654 RepID=A0A386H5U1_9CLOT|nr:hypothetical protein [Clostridium fermenticellae]AYD41082.1 hypothetical protein D4Z93_11320 [Clostridium fermenticellae]